MNWLEQLSIPEPNSGCWIWLRAIDRDGYGIFTRSRSSGQRMMKAHRLSYEQNVGSIPAGMMVLHKCDNPSCVNPQHLYCGNHSQNAKDALQRDRLRPTGRRPKLREHVKEIIASTETVSVLAKRYGVHRHSIQLIRAGKTWGGLE